MTSFEKKYFNFFLVAHDFKKFQKILKKIEMLFSENTYTTYA
jgi:hypothetical protein